MKIPENFKYTIIINQKVLAHITKDIHFEEAALFNYIQRICKEKNEKLDRHRSDGYTWLTYKKILKDMPLLKGRSEASLVDKIRRLEKNKLIQTKIKKVRGRQKKYFKIPTNIESIIGIEGNGELYMWLLYKGMNEERAAKIASDTKFMEKNKQCINRAIKNKLENPGAYINQAYKEHEDEKDIICGL